MGEFKGSADIIEDMRLKMKSFGEDVEKELSRKMLNAGAKVVVKEWKDGIQRHHHVKTGRMRDSVRFKDSNKNFREIYPHDKDESGMRNAEKAFIIHYGTEKNGGFIRGDEFVDDIEAKADVSAALEMQEVFDDYLERNGFY